MRGSEKPTETFVFLSFFYTKEKKKIKRVSKAKASQTSIPSGHFSSQHFFLSFFSVNKTKATCQRPTHLESMENFKDKNLKSALTLDYI